MAFVRTGEIDCKFSFQLEFRDPSKYDDLRLWLAEQGCNYTLREERSYYSYGFNTHGQSFKCNVSLYDYNMSMLFKLTWM